MARNNQVMTAQGREKEFLNLFNQLCYSRTSWQVWADLITTMACAISNAVEYDKARREAREKEYEHCIKRLGGSNEIPAQIFSIVVMALEENPNQDFLGKLYMNLNLGNHWKGQFFTPYHVCELMARMTVENCGPEIERKGFISICDPCIGGGAMMIAAANVLRDGGINYQNHALFVGQDLDRIVAMMAYIQLSLMGCPGYIAVGDSLIHPLTGDAMFPDDRENLEMWYMPMFFSDVWNLRRMFRKVNYLTSQISVKAQQTKKEDYMFFFNLDKEETT